METQGGIKHDAGKARWDLLPPVPTESVVRVLTHGALKYDDDNWRRVPHSDRRYFAAALRHLMAWRRGEVLDLETGEPHTAHAICNLLFILERDLAHQPTHPEETDT